MTFLIIWGLLTGAVLAVAGLIWAIRRLVIWLNNYPRAKTSLGLILFGLAITAYASTFIWAAVSL